MEIRVLIADHHKLCRSGIRMLVEKEADLRVVAEVGDGATTMDVLERERPDVLLIEVALREPSAPRVTTAALERWPHLAIVVLGALEDERHLREFFRIGVHGFVLKKSVASDMLQAIRTVHRGHRYVAPELLGRLVRPQTSATEIHPSHQCGLTPRETEVCRLVAYGHTNAEISAILHISQRTVESHRTSIIAKLDIKNRAELVRFAIAHGLLGVD